MVLRTFSLSYLTVVLAACATVASGEPLAKPAYPCPPNFSGSFAASQDGVVTHSGACGAADPTSGRLNHFNTVFKVGSVSKQFTAVAVMKLVRLGQLNLDDRVRTVLRDAPATWQDVTAHHLLSHTSGIPDFVDRDDRDAWMGKRHTPEEVMALFANLPLDFGPGTQASYSSSNYVVLGRMVEAITGKPFRDVIRSGILEPAGLGDTGYEPATERLAVGLTGTGETAELAPQVDQTVAFATGDLFSTAGDLIRWCQALLAGGVLPNSDRNLSCGRPTKTPSVTVGMWSA